MHFPGGSSWPQPVELWLEDRWLRRVQTTVAALGAAAAAAAGPRAGPPGPVSTPVEAATGGAGWLIERVALQPVRATVSLSASLAVRCRGHGAALHPQRLTRTEESRRRSCFRLSARRWSCRRSHSILL
jgi:hypothetical protein